MIEKVIGFFSVLVLMAAFVAMLAIAVLVLGGACWAALFVWKSVFAFFM